MNKKKVLIGSPIRQDPEILEQFLLSLKELDKENILLEYFFIDDNDNLNSKELLKTFSKEINEKSIIENGEIIDEYIRTADTHIWKENLIWKVAEYKNRIINYCKNHDFDYAFLIDSDLVLHPKTLKQLISTNKDIISEIFWTKWSKDTMELPQVWLYDQYSLIAKNRGEQLNVNEEKWRFSNFLQQLKKPGVYEIGGLGACTLISKTALDKGVDFSEIYNLSFWGEDRHFCIRAAALGFKLYVDTNYPAYHIYRMEYLEGVEKFKSKYRNSIYFSSSEVLKIEIENFTKRFLENFYSFNYKNFNGFKNIEDLSSLYKDKLTENSNYLIEYLVGKKIICTAKVIEFMSSILNSNNNQMNIECNVELHVEKDSKVIKKHFICTVVLKLKEDKKWIIDYINFKTSNNFIILGFSLVDLIEEKTRIDKDKDNTVTLAMLVRNESKKFIREVLSHAAKYIDNAVILDDASDDNTAQICKEVFKDIPLKLVSNKEPSFNNEIVLRKQLWQMAIETNPDWILILDCDEIFEDKIIDGMPLLINQSSFDTYYFRLYDMWDESHYREDTYWQAHNFSKPFLVRYQPNFEYVWNEAPLHCGRFPMNIVSLTGCSCNIRLKHLGWSTKQIREEKFKRYLKLDPQGIYGNMQQYISILDENPRLIEWKD